MCRNALCREHKDCEKSKLDNANCFKYKGTISGKWLKTCKVRAARHTQTPSPQQGDQGKGWTNNTQRNTAYEEEVCLLRGIQHSYLAVAANCQPVSNNVQVSNVGTSQVCHEVHILPSCSGFKD